ncbi:MAG TPA: hypothetical protein VH559_06085 [Gemmatimonadaceae bacterium]|jgi:hypothetical protein
MELHFQFGWGMMEHCRALLAAWGGGTAILSPRDLSDAQLRKLADTINRLPGGSVLLDPQFYLPHADHERLRSHAYWPPNYSTGTFWQGAPLRALLRSLRELNDVLRSRAFVLPGILTERIDDDWLAIQQAILTEAVDLQLNRPLIATVALGADAVRNSSQIAELIEASRDWEVQGVYLVAEHPNGAYLVNDPIWLANIVDLVAAFRLRRLNVTLGYCNHQMLIAGCVKATAIASGTWMNVRSFPPDKFRTAYEEEIKQRTTWYYCPQGLSEYKLPFLDIAQRRGLLAQMVPPTGFSTSYASMLFAGGQPSVLAFTEQAAFRHYLECLRTQTMQAVEPTFDATVARHESLLSTAEAVLQQLTGAGVRGQMRDFGEMIDVNRAALADLVSTRGPILRRVWANL